MNNLKELRKKKGITQKEFSKKFSIPLRTLQSWENGEGQIKLGKAKELAEYFNVSLDHLFGYTNGYRMNNLKELRLNKEENGKRGVTQQEVADKIGVTKRTYIYWEKNERQIKPDKAQQLAEYFNVSVGHLLGFTDKEENDKTMNNSMVIKEYTDIPLVRSAVEGLNMDIKNNPGLKYEIVGYSICKDEVLNVTVSGILVHWEGTQFKKR